MTDGTEDRHDSLQDESGQQNDRIDARSRGDGKPTSDVADGLFGSSRYQT